MSVNIKLGEYILKNKDTVKIPLADDSGNLATFNLAPGNVYTVSFSVDGETAGSLSVPIGKSISNFYSPTKSGYVFSGWATSSTAIIPDIVFPYTPSGNVTLYAVFNTIAQYKSIISGYGSSSPSSVVFSTNADLTNWIPESDSISGNAFVQIPTFYRKVVASPDNQITSFIISTWKEDNDFVPYSIFYDENGNLLPHVYIGKYRSSSAVGQAPNSVSGSAITRAIGEARGHLNPLNTGYQLYDWQFQKLWQDLICAKMRTIDINSGSGIENDVLGIAWNKSGTWIDGVASIGTGTSSDPYRWLFSYKPSKYMDSPTVSPKLSEGYNIGHARPGANGNITKLGYDPSHPFFNYPMTASGSSYTSYYCDGYYHGSGSHPVLSLVGSADARYGAFRCDAYASWSGAYGVRLCYRPLVTT